MRRAVLIVLMGCQPAQLSTVGGGLTGDDRDTVVDLHTTFCGIDERRGRTLKALYRRSRIRTRHSVLFESSDGPVETRQPFYPPATDDEDPGPTTAERMEVYAREAPPLAIRAARAAQPGGGDHQQRHRSH